LLFSAQFQEQYAKIRSHPDDVSFTGITKGKVDDAA
jgi:hypothetical protein